MKGKMAVLKRKLGSRKFWALLVAVITSTLVLFNVDNNTIAKVVALVTNVGAIATYILIEGYIDGKRIAKEPTGGAENGEPDYSKSDSTGSTAV